MILCVLLKEIGNAQLDCQDKSGRGERCIIVLPNLSKT